VNLHEVLRSLRDGKIGVDEAVTKIRISAVKEVEGACLDISREMRKEVPEIILAEGKSIDDLVRISQVLYLETGRVIITRISDHKANKIKKIFQLKAEISYNKKGKILVLKNASILKDKSDKVGFVAVFTAGTADIIIAEEAKVVLEEMGCHVHAFYDIGIAGIQRLFPALKKSLKEDVDAIIVIAGMEGALPTIVSSLVAVPVIGVPSSAGYGRGGKGEGALISMLQSCSPGLVVVNIDNGVGAAVAAALISKKIRNLKN
jgi:NCAIR mutase (PurE)-related protein